MKKSIFLFLFLISSTLGFSHEYNHYAELFAQILFPVALFGCLVSIPLSFLVVTQKFDKKISQMIYGGYCLASFLFFAILRLLYSFIHNHFELTCQVIAFGLYLSIISCIIFIGKYIYFKKNI